MPAPLSIIIPTLNEAQNLPTLLAELRAAARGPIEIIVSDCDSPDGTADLAEGAVDHVTRHGCGRSDAMNRGAARATSPVLLFLHADTRLPDGFDQAVLAACRRPGIVGGAFEFSFGSHKKHHGLNRWTLRVVTFLNRVRYRLCGQFFGDQAIFCRRDVFERLGGYPRVPLLEDARFCAAMARLGRTAVLRPACKTSPRRFVDRGVLRQMLTDMYLLMSEWMGEYPHDAWRKYNAVNQNAAKEILANDQCPKPK